MHNLILLRGIPGSGKSTWVKSKGLEQYTISSDALRLMYAGVEINLNGKEVISQKSDKIVWEVLFSILERRMEKGLFTIIDATHTSEKSLNVYNKLCEKYNYRKTIVEFNVDLKTCLDRNEKREVYKRVPSEVIENMYKKLQEPLSEKNKKCLISSLNFSIPSFLDFEDLNEYEEIVCFGDIHSCYAPLKEYFDKKPYSENKFYVFIGDLIDRGLQPNETVEFIYSLISKPNVIVVTGNHELWIKRWIRGEDVEGMSGAFQKTLRELTDDNKQKLREIGRKCRQVFCFNYKDKNYICTHGGIPTPYANITTPTEQLIKGIGAYEDMQKCDEKFAEWTLLNYYSIHGHRNIENVEIQNTDRTFNLCDNVEFGGYLRILEITNSYNTIKIKNNIYNKIADISFKDQILKALSESKYVKEKELNNGIISFNFTREAFYKDHWDNISVLARGLFVDSETEKIVARSYSKFFNAWFEENDSNTEREYGDCSIYALKDKIKFPVSVYKKENGYLGIVSWDYKNNTFFIASKSTNLAEYALHFKEMFMKWYNKQNTEIKENIKKVVQDNQSMIFEVIDEEFDPHIIHNACTKQFVLLDILKNDFSETYWCYDSLRDFAIKNTLLYKAKIIDIDSFGHLEYFLGMYKDFSLNDEPNGCFEGFVIQDADGFRFKFKTAYYCFWKSLRNKLGAYKMGYNVNFSLEEKELLSKLGGKDKCCEKNVLQLQKMYYDKED